MNDTQILMKNSSEKPITRIRVGTFQSIAIYFWPYLLAYIKQNPYLSVSMKTGRSQDMVNSLMKHELDIALTVEGTLYPETIRHELYHDEYCTYVSARYPLTRISKKKIKDMTLLYIPDALDQDGISLRQHLYMTDLQLKEIFELDSFEVIAEFTRKNYGLGILPRKVAASYGKALKEVRLEGTAKKYFGKHRFFLSYRKDLDLPQSTMNLFVNSANKAVMDMNK